MPIYPKNTIRLMDKDALALTTDGKLMYKFEHHFSLYHTHDGTSRGKSDANAENVPRVGAGSNCTVNGDRLCDTDADPAGATANCVHTGTGGDKPRNTYTPQLNNVMTNFQHACRNQFAASQYGRIANALTL